MLYLTKVMVMLLLILKKIYIKHCLDFKIRSFFLIDANNPCDDVFCQNGGECEVSVDKTKSVSFRCNCQFGFFGKLCEHC